MPNFIEFIGDFIDGENGEATLFAGLDAEEIDYAHTIAATPFTFFQIVDASPANSLVTVRDLGTNEQKIMVDRALARSAERGFILGGRLVPYEDDHYVLETPLVFSMRSFERYGAY